MQELVKRPLFSATAPTQGAVAPGTVIQGAGGMWRAVSRVDTTVANAVSSTEYTLASAGGISAGDIIGVLASDGGTHWSVVDSVTDSSVVIRDAPTADVVSGAAVGTTRWVYVPDVSA